MQYSIIIIIKFIKSIVLSRAVEGSEGSEGRAVRAVDFTALAYLVP